MNDLMYLFPWVSYRQAARHSLSEVGAALQQRITTSHLEDRHSYNTVAITERPAEHLIVIHWGHFGRPFPLRGASLYPVMYCRLQHGATGNHWKITIRPPYGGFVFISILTAFCGLCAYLCLLKKDSAGILIALGILLFTLVAWLYSFNTYARKYRGLLDPCLASL